MEWQVKSLTGVDRGMDNSRELKGRLKVVKGEQNSGDDGKGEVLDEPV